MPDSKSLRMVLQAAVLWAVLAAATFGMRDWLETVVLLWAPSGVAVAAFQASERSRWPLLATVLFPVQTITVWVSGTELFPAIAFSLAILAQATITAIIGLRVLGGLDRTPSRFSQVLGLFLAAIAGCTVGAMIAFPFFAVTTLQTATWWFLAHLLGILTVAPLITIVRDWRYRGVAVGEVIAPRLFVVAIMGYAGIAAATLAVNTIAMLPMLVAALVLITVRFGQAASTISILVLAGIATYQSAGGNSPVPILPWPVPMSTIAVQGWMLVMLAAALPIAAMILKRDELQHELIRRNGRMYESLLMLDLAEQMTGIGRWRIDLVTGEQDWSNRMLEMHGLPRDTIPDLEDVGALLSDGGDTLFGQIEANAEQREPYSFDYSVFADGTAERILRMSILNEFDISGTRIALFGVAVDVTEQVQREEALNLARGEAEQLAAEAQELANTDALTNLPNRRCTFARLETMVDVAQRRGSALTAIMFDIDHFKAINDTHGHQTGDEVIVQVAELGRRQARQGDVVGRIGGEEFVWLVPGLTVSDARRLAERLRRSVESGIEGSSLPNVTISVGMAQFHAGDSGDDLLARADTALYQAKESGRNQVQRAA